MTKGFVVRQSEEEDEFRLSAAAMAHVIHSDPERFNFGDINWVPISFGLGVSDNSQARYYLGTGIRFGQKFFLTAGAAVGPVKRLPATLSLDPQDKRNFTTDANALGSLQTRNESAFFIGVSYSFAGVGPSNFSGPFTPVKPAPTGATQTPGAAPAASASAPVSVGAVVELKATETVFTGRTATYNIIAGVPSTGTATQVEIDHTLHDVAALTGPPAVRCTVTGPGAAAHPCPPNVTFPLKVTIEPGTTYTFTTTMSFAGATNPAKELPVTVKHGTPPVTITKSVKVPAT